MYPIYPLTCHLHQFTKASAVLIIVVRIVVQTVLYLRSHLPAMPGAFTVVHRSKCCLILCRVYPPHGNRTAENEIWIDLGDTSYILILIHFTGSKR